jgi:hypothetical protein
MSCLPCLSDLTTRTAHFQNGLLTSGVFFVYEFILPTIQDDELLDNLYNIEFESSEEFTALLKKYVNRRQTQIDS